MQYNGIEEYKGNSGYLLVEFDEELNDHGQILIFLDSVETQEIIDDELISVSSDERSYEDISFDYSAVDGVFFIDSMHVETIGCLGVKEFVEALLKQKDAMDNVDTLIPVIVSLLKKKRCAWAKTQVARKTEDL